MAQKVLPSNPHSRLALQPSTLSGTGYGGNETKQTDRQNPAGDSERCPDRGTFADAAGWLYSTTLRRRLYLLTALATNAGKIIPDCPRRNGSGRKRGIAHAGAAAP